jgi:hypothetical protein
MDGSSDPAPGGVHTKTWRVRVDLFEDGDVTSAHAVMECGDTSLQAHSASLRDPVDRPMPQIGDEFAAGRALIDLGYQLLRAGQADTRANTVLPERP